MSRIRALHGTTLMKKNLSSLQFVWKALWHSCFWPWPLKPSNISIQHCFNFCLNLEAWSLRKLDNLTACFIFRRWPVSEGRCKRYKSGQILHTGSLCTSIFPNVSSLYFLSACQQTGQHLSAFLLVNKPACQRNEAVTDDRQQSPLRSSRSIRQSDCAAPAKSLWAFRLWHRLRR